MAQQAGRSDRLPLTRIGDMLCQKMDGVK